MSHRKTIWGFVVKPSWQSVGNLNNGRNAGPFYANANNGLANANWNNGGRQSDLHTPYYTTTTVHTSECEAAMARLTKQNSRKITGSVVARRALSRQSEKL